MFTNDWKLTGWIQGRNGGWIISNGGWILSNGGWILSCLINHIHIFNTFYVSTCDFKFSVAQPAVSQNLYVKVSVPYSDSAASY